jgi:hypothetical protein
VPFIGPEAVGDDQSSVVMELQWLRPLLKMRGRNGGGEATSECTGCGSGRGGEPASVHDAEVSQTVVSMEQQSWPSGGGASFIWLKDEDGQGGRMGC